MEYGLFPAAALPVPLATGCGNGGASTIGSGGSARDPRRARAHSPPPRAALVPTKSAAFFMKSRRPVYSVSGVISDDGGSFGSLAMVTPTRERAAGSSSRRRARAPDLQRA